MTKVLVIDDDVAILDSLELALSSEGYEVKTYSGTKIKRILNESRPDILLLDIWMPKLDGREILEWIRKEKDFSALPIILISAVEEAKEIAKQYNVKALPKPFSISELVTKIESVLNSKK